MYFLNFYFINNNSDDNTKIINLNNPNFKLPIYSNFDSIEDVIKRLIKNCFIDKNKKIVFPKYKSGNLLELNNENNPYWSYETTLLEYITYNNNKTFYNDNMIIFYQLL